MPEIEVRGQDGHQLEVNGIGRGALSPGGKRVPVELGWARFAAIKQDDTMHRHEDRYVHPVQNDPVDLT